MEPFSFNYFGSTILARSLGPDWIPPLEETLSAHCVPLTADTTIVAVNVLGRGIDIPGGHIDEGETALEAVKREAFEEAGITVTNLALIDVWKLSSSDEKMRGLAKKPYLLVYVADIESMPPFTPNNEVDERFVLEPQEFVARYFANSVQAQSLVNKALQRDK